MAFVRQALAAVHRWHERQSFGSIYSEIVLNMAIP